MFQTRTLGLVVVGGLFIGCGNSQTRQSDLDMRLVKPSKAQEIADAKDVQFLRNLIIVEHTDLLTEPVQVINGLGEVIEPLSLDQPKVVEQVGNSYKPVTNLQYVATDMHVGQTDKFYRIFFPQELNPANKKKVFHWVSINGSIFGDDLNEVFHQRVLNYLFEESKKNRFNVARQTRNLVFRLRQARASPGKTGGIVAAAAIVLYGTHYTLERVFGEDEEPREASADESKADSELANSDESATESI